MAENKNYTLNFGFGRPLCGLNLACAKLACAEVQRIALPARVIVYG
jgi:hypothetical protein